MYRWSMISSVLVCAGVLWRTPPAAPGYRLQCLHPGYRRTPSFSSSLEDVRHNHEVKRSSCQQAVVQTKLKECGWRTSPQAALEGREGRTRKVLLQCAQEMRAPDGCGSGMTGPGWTRTRLIILLLHTERDSKVSIESTPAGGQLR